MTKVPQLFLTLVVIVSIFTVNVEGNFGGLSIGFYALTCPTAELLVKSAVQSAVNRDKRTGAGLVRVFFHDCFAEGCDASVLIDSTPNNSAEKDGRPNLTLHGFDVIDAAKSSIEAVCPGTVSCADILAIAARDSINLLGGPWYAVKTGRRDGTVSLASTANSDIPSPTDDLQTLTNSFGKKGLSQSQMVTLSGTHTIGKGSCGAFTNRLYPTVDPTLDAAYADTLKAQCPEGSTTPVVNMDPVTPTVVDNQYYTNLIGHKGLFNSDQTLYNSASTQPQVVNNAQNPTLWKIKLVEALGAMGSIGVKTGTNGQIRKNCRVVNP